MSATNPISIRALFAGIGLTGMFLVACSSNGGPSRGGALSPDRNPGDFRLLVMGPVLLFGLALLAAFVVFGISNGPSSPRGAGMTPH
jgi:hypothetical protein